MKPETSEKNVVCPLFSSFGAVEEGDEFLGGDGVANTVGMTVTAIARGIFRPVGLAFPSQDIVEIKNHHVFQLVATEPAVFNILQPVIEPPGPLADGRNILIAAKHFFDKMF